MHPTEYDNIARHAATHWWYQGLRALATQMLEDLPKGHWCDVGCGTGHLLPVLPDTQPVAIDTARAALRYVSGQTKAMPVRGNLTSLPFPDDTFDGVSLMDVLYHAWVPDKPAAMREAARMLRPGGTLIINVPAYELLRSGHDNVIMTDKRFTRREVRELIRCAGMEVVRCTHWNAALLPAIAAVRLLSRRKAAQSDVAAPGKIEYHIGSAALRLERALLHYTDLPFGVSILAVARKPYSDS
jgi:SAM-dependent methyltransferase